MNLYQILAGTGKPGKKGWQGTKKGFKPAHKKPCFFIKEESALECFERAKDAFKIVSLYVSKDVDEVRLSSEEYIKSLKWEVLKEVY